MNRIEFVVEAADAPGSEALGVPWLAILIDGVRLQELVRPIERPLALAEVDGDEDEAPSSGGYVGLGLSDGVFWPSLHFLGEPELSYCNEGDTVLLGCPCGLWGCWPLSARVDVTNTSVTWSGFFNGMRKSWDLAGLGPFVFDRRQYEASLRSTAPPSATPLSNPRKPPPEYLQV
ncbi:hypothetical protein [Glycomyces buryatensis]|uniref:hypothetical protein n=1 Tax=Glycomyces buryatensis TaxID=2570927 RepID=UPI001B3C164C|nr:hypothetical protein [Glycomyces buryatensis]